MGKKKKKKEKKQPGIQEGEESEEEEEQQKDSDGSDNDVDEKKDVVPDAVEGLAVVEEDPGVRNDLIPGWTIGKGLRTERKDDEYPGAGTYKNLPTDFPNSNLDKAKKEKAYQQEKELLLNKYNKARHYKSESIGPDQYTIPIPKGSQKYSFGQRAEQNLLRGGPKHLQYRKFDGPGPGAYVPTEDNFHSKSKNMHTETNWGRSGRDQPDTTKKYPAPNKYNPDTRLQPRFLSELSGNLFAK